MTDSIGAGRRQEKGPEGRFANFFNIGHNAFEVVLEFGQWYEGDAEAQVHTRIVTGPAYAKTLLEVLGSCLQQIESDFGPVAPVRASSCTSRYSDPKVKPPPAGSEVETGATEP